MYIKLLIMAINGANFSDTPTQECFFEEDQIINIGRGQPNEVPLKDPHKKVSRNHARILVTADGPILEDLKSKNFTFLNDRQLPPGQSQLLQSGDVITVGDFNIHYYRVASKDEPVNPELKDTIYAATAYPANPFEEAVNHVVQSLSSLCQVYDEQPGTARSSQLYTALEQKLQDFNGHEVVRVLHQASEAHLRSLALQPDPLHASHYSDAPAVLTSRSSSASAPAKSNTYETVTLNTVMDALLNLIRVAKEFKEGTLGLSQEMPQETAFFFNNGKDDIINHLTNSRLGYSEFERRLHRLKALANETVQHQQGLMVGYKAVTREVLEILLRELDPELVEEFLIETQASLKIFPFLRAKATLNKLKQNAAHIRHSGSNTYEQRVYRPVFIKAYLSFMEMA